MSSVLICWITVSKDDKTAPARTDWFGCLFQLPKVVAQMLMAAENLPLSQPAVCSRPVRRLFSKDGVSTFEWEHAVFRQVFG